MLATLLLGVREIGTPLAVGYTWLLALWLAVGSRVPEPDRASGVVADVYRLAQAAELIAVGVAVSVGAYVIGVIATQLGLNITYAAEAIIRRGKDPHGRNQDRRSRRGLATALAFGGMFTVAKSVSGHVAPLPPDPGSLRPFLRDLRDRPADR